MNSELLRTKLFESNVDFLKGLGHSQLAVELIHCPTNRKQCMLVVKICWGHMMKCLLVKVRLWLFTLDGGIERFQILLCVWHRVVCLEKWKRQRERQSVSADWLRSSDHISLPLPLTH